MGASGKEPLTRADGGLSRFTSGGRRTDRYHQPRHPGARIFVSPLTARIWVPLTTGQMALVPRSIRTCRFGPSLNGACGQSPGGFRNAPRALRRRRRSPLRQRPSPAPQ